ncbi:hypothetical protein AB0M45_33740 [Nocardia sp. NPDC051787]|uniref:hypothetical protein n=1 Tax=Nocardia sp. NPDC051787 TaxID=3155415 RepID=UPI003422803A
MTDLQSVTIAVVGIEALFIVAALCWPPRQRPAHHDKHLVVRRGKRHRASTDPVLPARRNVVTSTPRTLVGSVIARHSERPHGGHRDPIDA